MEDDAECMTGLCLGLGMGGHLPKKEKRKLNKPLPCLDLAFELCPKREVQKQALADQLNLKTRQIEVWFQNRRARTKLKQTEVDYELLKKQCQNLSDENKRLKKELQELRALKLGPSPLCIQLSKAATLSVCSSCEKLLKMNEGKNNVAISETKLRN
ncbi:Leucine zipper, homeobox-associated [Sesbania bispinosa]|nr:Leucine zipper, homeobox-associated [Sesbania bispinosa]